MTSFLWEKGKGEKKRGRTGENTIFFTHSPSLPFPPHTIEAQPSHTSVTVDNANEAQRAAVLNPVAFGPTSSIFSMVRLAVLITATAPGLSLSPKV